MDELDLKSNVNDGTLTNGVRGPLLFSLLLDKLGDTKLLVNLKQNFTKN